MNNRIGQWIWEKREKLLILLGVVLVGILCFEAGFLQGKIRPGAPLVLSVPETSQDVSPEKKEPIPPFSGVSPVGSVVEKDSTVKVDCPFVGSKNSNKYHVATCLVAKRIKPENRVCFASKEEAEKRNYIPSCLK